MLQFIRAAASLPEQSTGPSPPLLLIQTASLDPATPRGSLPRSPAHRSADAPATCAPRSVSDSGACSHHRVSVRRCPPPRSVAKPMSIHLSLIPRYTAHTEYGSMQARELLWLSTELWGLCHFQGPTSGGHSWQTPGKKSPSPCLSPLPKHSPAVQLADTVTVQAGVVLYLDGCCSHLPGLLLGHPLHTHTHTHTHTHSKTTHHPHMSPT